MLEPFLEDADFFLAGAGFLQLRQRFLSEVLEGGAINLRAIAQGRSRELKGNASFALDLCKGLELRQGRNIDVKHRSLAPRPRRHIRSALICDFGLSAAHQH